MLETETHQPKYLGKQVAGADAGLDPIKWDLGEMDVTLNVASGNSFCPVSGQPDSWSMTITYRTNGFIAETKSVKLWLQGFHGRKAFNERITAELAKQFFEQIKPAWVKVSGKFEARGGISVHPEYFLDADKYVNVFTDPSLLPF